MVETYKSRSQISRRTVILSAAVVLFICGYLAAQFVRMDRIGTQSASGTANKSAPAASGGKMTMVTLIDGATLYGTVYELDIDGYITLNNAYYLTNADASPSDKINSKTSTSNLDANENALKRFGEEVHSPNSFVVVPLSTVLYREPLALDSLVDKAIAENEKANPIQVSKPSLLGRPYGAVFLQNGEVYFGKISLYESTVVIGDAYFLRFKDEAKQGVESITDLDEVELVPRASTPSGTTGQMVITTMSVLYVQTLANSSPVVDAIKLVK